MGTDTETLLGLRDFPLDRALVEMLWQPAIAGRSLFLAQATLTHLMHLLDSELGFLIPPVDG